MKQDLTEQHRRYKQQQTAAGSIAAANLAQMASELRSKTGVQAKGGKLTPIRNSYTREVTAYKED